MARQTRNRKRKLMSEINMTPLIDVMLVLLVIFMVTAPLLTSGVSVNLPNGVASNQKSNDDKKSIVISIDQYGKAYIGDVETPIDSIASNLRHMHGGYEQPKIFIRGDKSNSYGKIMDVMAKISAAGFKRVMLVTENTADVRHRENTSFIGVKR